MYIDLWYQFIYAALKPFVKKKLWDLSNIWEKDCIKLYPWIFWEFLNLMNFKCWSMAFPTLTLKIGRSILNIREIIIRITRSSSGFGKSFRLLIRINSQIYLNLVLDLQELPSMVSSTTYLIQKTVKQSWKLLKIPHRIIIVQ